MTKHADAGRASGDRQRVSIGVRGLDEIIGGGLPPDRLYLLDGEPGTGKTTIPMQFLMAGRGVGERGLYVTLSETAEELKAEAMSHGWSLEGIQIVELSNVHGETPDEAYTLSHPGRAGSRSVSRCTNSVACSAASPNTREPWNR